MVGGPVLAGGSVPADVPAAANSAQAQATHSVPAGQSFYLLKFTDPTLEENWRITSLKFAAHNFFGCVAAIIFAFVFLLANVADLILDTTSRDLNNVIVGLYGAALIPMITSTVGMRIIMKLASRAQLWAVVAGYASLDVGAHEETQFQGEADMEGISVVPSASQDEIPRPAATSTGSLNNDGGAAAVPSNVSSSAKASTRGQLLDPSAGHERAKRRRFLLRLVFYQRLFMILLIVSAFLVFNLAISCLLVYRYTQWKPLINASVTNPVAIANLNVDDSLMFAALLSTMLFMFGFPKFLFRDLVILFWILMPSLVVCYFIADPTAATRGNVWSTFYSHAAIGMLALLRSWSNERQHRRAFLFEQHLRLHFRFLGPGNRAKNLFGSKKRAGKQKSSASVAPAPPSARRGVSRQGSRETLDVAALFSTPSESSMPQNSRQAGQPSPSLMGLGMIRDSGLLSVMAPTHKMRSRSGLEVVSSTPHPTIRQPSSMQKLRPILPFARSSDSEISKAAIDSNPPHLVVSSESKDSLPQPEFASESRDKFDVSPSNRDVSFKMPASFPDDDTLDGPLPNDARRAGMKVPRDLNMSLSARGKIPHQWWKLKVFANREMEDAFRLSLILGHMRIELIAALLSFGLSEIVGIWSTDFVQDDLVVWWPEITLRVFLIPLLVCLPGFFIVRYIFKVRRRVIKAGEAVKTANRLPDNPRDLEDGMKAIARKILSQIPGLSSRIRLDGSSSSNSTSPFPNIPSEKEPLPRKGEPNSAESKELRSHDDGRSPLNERKDNALASSAGRGLHADLSRTRSKDLISKTLSGETNAGVKVGVLGDGRSFLMPEGYRPQVILGLVGFVLFIPIVSSVVLAAYRRVPGDDQNFLWGSKVRLTRLLPLSPSTLFDADLPVHTSATLCDASIEMSLPAEMALSRQP
jgi:hypothetical protein